MKDLGYGIINFNGKEYALTENAYYESGYGRGFSEFFTDVESGKMEYYTAQAVDESGNNYKIKWKITNPDAELEEDMCDWDNADAVELID